MPGNAVTKDVEVAEHGQTEINTAPNKLAVIKQIGLADFNESQSRVSQKHGAELAARLESYLSRETILRPRQRVVISDIIRHLDNGNAGGHIKRPTGTGKTVTFCSEVIAFNTPVGAMLPAWDKPTIVLVPRKLLCEQTEEEFTEKFQVSKDRLGIYHSGISDHDKAKALDRPILITTYGSVRTLLRKGLINLEDYPLVIPDEVHMAKGELTVPLIKQMLQTSIVHGYTATDTFLVRGAYRNISNYLYADNEPIHRTSFREAVNYREVAPVKNIIFETDVQTEIARTDADTSDYTDEQLRRVVEYEGRDEAAINSFAQFTDPDTGFSLKNMKSVWYCNGVTHAKKVASDLNIAFGEVYAVAVSGKTPFTKLQALLREQEEGKKLRAIVNADLLIQGWNSPSTQVCVMMRPSKSPTVVEQAGGRIGRLDPNNPFKIGYVLNFVDRGMYDALTFSQVVDGANVVPADYFEHFTRTGESNHERKVLFIDKIKIRVHYSMREIVSFLQRREAEEDANKLGPKTAEWLTKEEYDAYLGISSLNSKFIELWAEIIKDGKIDGKEIKCGYKKSGTREPFCVHLDEAELIAKKLGRNLIKIDGPKTAEWLSKAEFATLVRTSHRDKDFTTLWDSVKITRKIGKDKIVCGYRLAGKNKPFCVNASEVPAFIQKLGLNVDKKTTEWKAKTEFKALVGVGRSDKEFLKLWDKVEKTGKVGKVPVKSGYKDSGTIRPFCIHESEVSLFKKLLGYEEKTAEWLSQTELARAINIGTTNVYYVALIDEVKATGKIDGREVSNSYKVSGTISRFCIHKSEADFIKQKVAERTQATTGKTWAARSRRSSAQAGPEIPATTQLADSSQLICCADLWDELRKQGEDTSFIRLQKIFLRLAEGMPDDAECGKTYDVKSPETGEDIQLRYDIHPMGGEECLYADKAIVISMLHTKKLEITDATTIETDKGASIKTILPPAIAGRTFIPRTSVKSLGYWPEAPRIEEPVTTNRRATIEELFGMRIGSGGYADHLATALHIHDKVPAFKDALRLILAMEGHTDAEKFIAQINDIIASRKEADAYNDNFHPFDKAILERWMSVGAIYKNERRYLPLVCEILGIPQDSDDYEVFLSLAMDDNALKGRNRKIRSKYIGQHTIDGGFKPPTMGYFADFLYLTMKTGEINNEELAEALGAEPSDVESWREGKSLMSGEQFKRFGELLNLGKDHKYAHAIHELIRLDQLRLKNPDLAKRKTAIDPSRFEQRADLEIT